MILIGLMSGTSADGVDAALVEVWEDGETLPSARVRASLEVPMDKVLQSRILAAAADKATTREVALLRRDVTLAFVAAVERLLSAPDAVSRDQVAALGCHGQTVWHEPPAGDGKPVAAPGTSLQLLDPALLAERTGIPVVSDFRSADLAAGGEGAPLVPWGDAVLFGANEASVALLNLGGMANVTFLPAGRTVEGIVAFDTGPGNALIDEAVALATGGRERMDRDGAKAREGAVDQGLLARLMAHPFLDREPPRSTGRELFGRGLVERLAAERHLRTGIVDGWPDLVATLTAFTAESVAAALKRWILPRGVDRLVVAGGGVQNPVLMERLQAALAPLPVVSEAVVSEAGVSEEDVSVRPQAREAAAFGLLAWAFLEGRPGNVPEGTGASGPRVLGSWTPAPGRGRAGHGPGRGDGV